MILLRLKSLLLAGALLFAASFGYAEDVLGEMAVLNSRSAENQRPAIASWQDGTRVFVAWEGTIDGSRRIVMREQIAGVWLPDVIVDNEPAAGNNAPSIAVDSSGNPHIAWLGKVGDVASVYYAFRAGEEWMTWGPVASAQGTAAEAVVLRIGPDDRPVIVWQSGSGSQYSIYSARLGDAGQFKVENLTPRSTGLNLYPEVFFTPDVLVTWYRSEDSSFVLSGKRLAATGEWLPYEFIDFSKLPTNRLPLILRSSPGQFVGMWYDELDLVDRVFLGFEDPVTQGAGAVIDNQPDSINHLVSGTAAGEELVAVWCSDSLEEGSQVYLSHGTAPPFSDDILVSDGEKAYYTQPKVADTGAGVGVVWSSDATAGGNGNVFFRTVTFK